jgi:hypothetical protein
VHRLDDMKLGDCIFDKLHTQSNACQLGLFKRTSSKCPDIMHSTELSAISLPVLERCTGTVIQGVGLSHVTPPLPVLFPANPCMVCPQGGLQRELSPPAVSSS